MSFSLFSSKLILYILPVYSYVALISAYFLHTARTETLKNFIYTYRTLIILLSLGLIGLFYLNWIDLNTGSTVILIFLLIFNIGLFFLRFFNSRKKQLLSLSFLFSIVLIFSFRILGNQNPFLINSPIGLAEEIKDIEKEINKRKIAVFDTRLSSLPFYLDQKVISIHQNNSEARREILFEPNKNYRNYYWNIDNKEDMSRLINFLKNKEGVLITKRNANFDDTLKFYLERMKIKEIDRWILYY